MTADIKPQYVQQAPAVEQFSVTHLHGRGLQEVKVGEPLPPTIANLRLQSVSLQEQPHLQSRHDQSRHGVP